MICRKGTNMKDVGFGRRLQEKRKNHSLTCEELADKCFINNGYLRQIESGEIPGIALLIQLSDLLDTSPSYLLGFSDELQTEDRVLIEKINSLDEEHQKVVLYLLNAYTEYKNGQR